MNKNESAALVLLGVILVVVLAAIGYLSWREKKEASGQAALISQLVLPPGQASSSSSSSGSGVGTGTASGVATTTSITSSSEKIATGTASSSDAAPSSATSAAPAAIVPSPGWQAYDEAEYGVAGTFPEAWYEYDAVGLGGSLEFASVPESAVTTGGMVNSGDAEISTYRTLETLTQAEAEDSLSGMQEGATTATVAGESVPVVAYEVASSENTLVAYVPHDSYVYRVILAYHGETAFANVFSQFLATFRF